MLCIIESQPHTLGGLAEDKTRTSTPALRHAWNHHGHARNTIRYMAGGWSAGLQSWGSVSRSPSPPKPKAGPGQTGIMASGKASPSRTVSLFIPPLTPTFPDGGLRHNLTGTPFSRWPSSSIVFYLVVFRVQSYARAYRPCNSMTDANDPTLCSISNFVLPA